MTMAQHSTTNVTLNPAEVDGFSTSDHLRNAREQAISRGFDTKLIVDVDAHHYETESWREIVTYIEDPVLRQFAESGLRGATAGRSNPLVYQAPARQGAAGRIRRYEVSQREQFEGDVHRDVMLSRAQRESIGLDYQIVFPTPMLEMGMHPEPQVEVEVSWAYTNWFVEKILPQDRSIGTMVYLPFNDPAASERVVEKFAGVEGVCGFMVTATRYKPVHHNDYARLYGMIQESGLPLGFHASFHQQERMFEGMNRFLSIHALGFVIPNMVHLTNLVINGIPERFPRLKVIWIESGLAWIPFLMQRLDNEYFMRTSEAPLLRKPPSDYMRESFYYTTQPMETVNLRALEVTFEMIQAETQLMFASDYPHWDFNLPSSVYDLPFLSEQAKLNILGENAVRVLGLNRERIVSGRVGV
jgi:predicted TIM-barrel fold metal-dependent hydrolase